MTQSIEEFWTAFTDYALDRNDIAEADRRMLRQTFYAGAIAMFEMMLQMPEQPDNSARLLLNIHLEVKMFMQELAASFSQSPGSDVN